MTDPVACIGTGRVGRAWAIAFARAGHPVRLFDDMPAAAGAARDFAARMLPRLAGQGLLDGRDPAAVLDRIAVAPTLEAALDGAGHVQEGTPGDPSLKRAVFARLDAAAAPGAVIASSTSAILPSAFTAGLPGRARRLVVHPINPPQLVPAAEVVPAPWTDPEVVARAAALLRGCGMSPIVMKREIDGFVMNRLQGALPEEAFRLVESGVAGVEDVDTGIRDGLALRWSVMGPFETIDLNAPGGIRDDAARYQPMYDRMFPSMQWRSDWTGPVMDGIEADRRAVLPAEALADRQAWRDRRLMALVVHRRAAGRAEGG